ncbi:MAG: DUF368 domain-containing protein [Mycoplasmatales bacterium]
MLNLFYIVMSGFLMGVADTMPGISGSTITYILGIYERFITALSKLNQQEKFKESFIFLFKMGSGWFVGAIISILIIGKFVDSNIYFITSLFLGLVLMSIPITFKEAFKSYKIVPQKLIYTLGGFFLVLLVFMLGNQLTTNLLINNKIFYYIYVFIVAMLAISSMLLPGISGSTILLIFGVYYPLIEALNKLLSADLSSLSFIIVFALGAVSGLFSVAKILANVFEKYKSNTIYFIEGLLIGSILPIINAPLSIEKIGNSALSVQNFEVFPFILGIVILIGLANLKKIEKR